MVDSIRPELDLSGWNAALDQLQGPLRVSLARSMAVAGGKVLRDEAKQQVHTGELSHSKSPGLLKSAIYLAYKDAKSSERQVIYSVTWNSKIAPHGHLAEFGHWQYFAVVKLPNGDWFTDTSKRLATPKWTPAVPFLRPAFDAAHRRAQQAMIQRGRQRLPELLAGANPDTDE